MKCSRPSTREHVPPKQKTFTQQMSYALGCGELTTHFSRPHLSRPCQKCARSPTLVRATLAANAFALPIASQAERDFRERQTIEILKSFWPDLPQATLFNDVPAALFFLNAFLVVVGWPM